jgi:hypothetical protein
MKNAEIRISFDYAATLAQNAVRESRRLRSGLVTGYRLLDTGY